MYIVMEVQVVDLGGTEGKLNIVLSLEATMVSRVFITLIAYPKFSVEQWTWTLRKSY